MENKWKSEFRKWVERAGGICYLIHGHAMQAPGIPDVWVATRWWCGWIEFKQGLNHLSTAQRVDRKSVV